MKRTILMALVLLSFGWATAQNAMKVNTVVVQGSGDVTLRQGSEFKVVSDKDNANWTIQDSVLYLKGSDDFEVTVEALGYLDAKSSGDVRNIGTLLADNLVVRSSGSGDVVLNLDYINVLVQLSSSGDVVLRGYCENLQIDDTGSGEVVSA